MNPTPFKEPSHLYFFEVKGGEMRSKESYEGSMVVKPGLTIIRWIIPKNRKIHISYYLGNVVNFPSS